MLITAVSPNRKALKQFLSVIQLHYPVVVEETGQRLEFIIPDDLEVSILSLFNLVQQDCGFTLEQLKDHTCKKRKFVAARDVLLYLLNKYYKLTMAASAQLLGYKDHASTIQAVRKFNGLPHGRTLQTVYENAKRSYFRPWPIGNEDLTKRLLRMKPTEHSYDAKSGG